MTSVQVLDSVIRDNAHNRSFDAKDVYEYYRLRKEAEKNDETIT